MAYNKHTWVKRLGTGLNKFKDTITGQVMALVNQPDYVSQEGTPLRADWLNEMEEGIEAAHADINDLETGVKKAGDAAKFGGKTPADYAHRGTGNTFDAGHNTTLVAVSDDDGRAEFRAHGRGQGNGTFFAGQDDENGGGIKYTGSDDFLRLFIRRNSVDRDIFKIHLSGSEAKFEETPSVGDDFVYHTGNSDYLKGLNRGVSSQDPNTTTNQYFLSKHQNGPNSSDYFFYEQQFHGSISSTARRRQIAVGYNGASIGHVYSRVRHSTGWTPFKRVDNVDQTPAGVIVEWYGDANNVPAGWALCDGTNGTPDMRGRFVVGAGGSYGLGATGGANSVTLSSYNMPSHSHGKGSLTTSAAGAHTHSYTEVVDENPNISTVIDMSQPATQKWENSQTSTAGNHSHAINGSTSHSGGGQAIENRPPFLALHFIMKL